MSESDLRVGRTGFTVAEMSLMVGLLVFGLVVSVVGTVLAYDRYPEIAKLFAAAGITLLFGAIFGGVVKLLIDNFDRRRAQRAAQVDFIAKVLADLKGVHDRLDRGRTLMKAKQSAKSYGEEMTGFLGSSVVFKGVGRALRTDKRSEPIQAVIPQVELMNGYLRTLLDEFELEYKKTSLTQSMFEAHTARAMQSPPPDYSLDALQKNQPWERLKALPQLEDFLRPVAVAEEGSPGQGSNYVEKFLNPLNAASKTLRRALLEEVSS
ncbi:MAG: hypothetical protein JWQ49_5372 [Edaphobacter sp.]|nr:hypothetical protein [Edaphobacter sp.]